MSGSESDYDLGINNPSFDDKGSSHSITTTTTKTSTHKGTNRTRLKKLRKTISDVEETSFTKTSFSDTQNLSTATEAEKPYESDETRKGHSRRKIRKKIREISQDSTNLSQESINQSLTTETISDVSYKPSKKKKHPKSVDTLPRSSSVDCTDLLDNSKLTESSTTCDVTSTVTTSGKNSIGSFKRKSSFQKLKDRLWKSSDEATDRNTSTSKSLSSQLDERISQNDKESSDQSVTESKKLRKLSSGEVVFNEPSERPIKVKKKIKSRKKNISEETIEQESSEVLIEKPRKKKRKERLVESVTTTQSENEPVREERDVLGVLIHRIDGLKMHYFISHPVVQVHLFDLNSGTYVAKRKESKAITSYYEKASAPVSYIMPVMTQPYEMKGKAILTPEWQELLIFNEKFTYFTQDEPNVLIFFEILDFISMTQASRQYRKLGKDGGWHRVAWAFLKLVGANSVVNTGKKVRLQLYYPLDKSKWKSSCFSNVSKEIFGWWHNKSKKKYPYTLYVTVKGIELPEVQPGLRSMIPTQEERGHMTIDDLQRTLQGKSPSISEERSLDNQSELGIIRWNRMPGQLCKIPNKLLKKIHVGKSAFCFVIKFSNNGRFLACGATENNNTHSILIYEIPSGDHRGKCCYHFGLIYDLLWNSSDSQLISSSADCTARLWKMEKGKPQSNQILPHPSFVYSSKFHPRVARIVVTACYDHVVRVWDTSKEECELLQELAHHIKFVNAICFDEEGDSLFSGDGVGVVCVWNVYVTSQPNRPALIRDWILKQDVKCKDLHCKVINDIILHPGGRRILISTRDNCLRLYDSTEFILLQKYDGHHNLLEYLHCCFSPCGSYIFSGSEDGSIHVWNSNSGSKVQTLSPYTKSVNSVQYHPHEHMFACCSYDENEPVLIYGYEQDACSSFMTLHTIPHYSPPPIAPPKLPASGILKYSSGQVISASSNSQVSSAVIEGDEATTTTEDSCETLTPKPKPRKSKSSSNLTRVSFDTSDTKETTDRSRTVTFEDEVQPSSSKWQSVFDKLNEIIDSTTSDSNLSTYVESSSITTRTLETETSQNTSLDFKVISLYSYKARNESELNLKPGDVITVINEVNDNWSEGILKNGTRGLFPANYVYRIEDSFSSVTSPSANDRPVRQRRRRKTHALTSSSGSPIFLSASEDETVGSSHDHSTLSSYKA